MKCYREIQKDAWNNSGFERVWIHTSVSVPSWMFYQLSHKATHQEQAKNHSISSNHSLIKIWFIPFVAYTFLYQFDVNILKLHLLNWPLTPMCARTEFLLTISSTQVMKIKKNIHKEIISWSSTKSSELIS